MCWQGVTSASHVERDEVAGLTYDFTMDFTARLKGLYHLFCIPDDVNQEPYLLAKIQDDPCYIHRCIAGFPLCICLSETLLVLFTAHAHALASAHHWTEAPIVPCD